MMNKSTPFLQKVAENIQTNSSIFLANTQFGRASSQILGINAKANAQGLLSPKQHDMLQDEFVEDVEKFYIEQIRKEICAKTQDALTGKVFLEIFSKTQKKQLKRPSSHLLDLEKKKEQVNQSLFKTMQQKQEGEEQQKAILKRTILNKIKLNEEAIERQKEFKMREENHNLILKQHEETAKRNLVKSLEVRAKLEEQALQQQQRMQFQKQQIAFANQQLMQERLNRKVIIQMKEDEKQSKPSTTSPTKFSEQQIKIQQKQDEEHQRKILMKDYREKLILDEGREKWLKLQQELKEAEALKLLHQREIKDDISIKLTRINQAENFNSQMRESQVQKQQKYRKEAAKYECKQMEAVQMKKIEKKDSHMNNIHKVEVMQRILDGDLEVPDDIKREFPASSLLCLDKDQAIQRVLEYDERKLREMNAIALLADNSKSQTTQNNQMQSSQNQENKEQKTNPAVRELTKEDLNNCQAFGQTDYQQLMQSVERNLRLKTEQNKTKKSKNSLKKQKRQNQVVEEDEGEVQVQGGLRLNQNVQNQSQGEKERQKQQQSELDGKMQKQDEKEQDEKLNECLQMKDPFKMLLALSNLNKERENQRLQAMSNMQSQQGKQILQQVFDTEREVYDRLCAKVQAQMLGQGQQVNTNESYTKEQKQKKQKGQINYKQKAK